MNLQVEFKDSGLWVPRGLGLLGAKGLDFGPAGVWRFKAKGFVT